MPRSTSRSINPTHEVVYAVLKTAMRLTASRTMSSISSSTAAICEREAHERGRADATAKIHANRIRAMDVRWGLRQVRKGMANSQIHAKQPPKYSKGGERR